MIQQKENRLSNAQTANQSPEYSINNSTMWKTDGSPASLTRSVEPVASLSDYAARYARYGFIPIPVRPNGKLPAASGWQKSLPGEAEAIDRMARHRGNIGLTFPTDLFALDVDTKPGKQGASSLQALEDVHGELPRTLEQRTASGGRHLIFRKPPTVTLKNTAGVLGTDLDIRAHGGQIVAEPSTIAGAAYSWIDWDVIAEEPEIADAPAWLLELLTAPEKPRKKGRIAEGGRNQELFRRACAMQAAGEDDDYIYRELHHLNSTLCNPPLSDHELRTIANSALSYDKGDAEQDAEWMFATEQDLSERLARRAHGLLRWTPGMEWMQNVGTHWKRDETLARFSLASATIKAAIAGIDDAKTARAVSKAAVVPAILSLARSAPGIITPVEEWDKHIMLLNTPAGAFDLETGKEVSRDGLLFTQVTGVAPCRMPTPVWDRFISSVFADDLEMVEFIQRMAGYALTGSIKEQKLFFLHGSGSNGKSVFLDVLQAIGGTYNHNLPSEALMTSKHEGHPTMFASLHGKRMAVSSEIEESAHWAESRIKAMTGDGQLTARFMHKDFFTFDVTHKHIIAGNFKPRLKGDDYAMVRRLVLVPFMQRFEGAQRDSNLPDKLRAEYPGILAWAIDGAVKWAASGLMIPGAVADASRTYMEEQNDIEQWLQACCKRTATAETGSAALYESFAKWKEQNGEHAPAQRNFSQRLERMFNKRRTKHGAVFSGVALAPSGADYYAASRGF